MPGMALSASTMTRRRRSNSATILAISSCGPAGASTAAHAAIEGGFQARRFRRIDGHGHAAEELQLLGIGDPERARDQDLVARIHEGHEDVVERVLGPAGHRHLLGSVLEREVALELLADGGPELGDASHLRVLRLSALDGADGRVLDAA